MVERLRLLFDAMGVEWVLWLLLGLSVISLAMMVERCLYFRRRAPAIDTLTQAIRSAFADSSPLQEAERLAEIAGMETAVLSRALRNLHRGPDALEDLIYSEVAQQREFFDRYLVFLGTLGNNAPFIGLFGTVLGIIDAFASLQTGFNAGDESQNAAIMGSISEALVATAVGLLVAIPAVVAFNAFKRGIRRRMANTESLTRLLLAHIKSEGKSA